MKKLFIVFACIISLNASGQDIPKFAALLENCGIIFSIRPGFLALPVKENETMPYDFAISYTDRKFELRYIIKPITLKNYENDEMMIRMENEKQTRNSFYEKSLEQMIMDISGGVKYEFEVFDGALVNKEFNADWGASAFLKPKSDFSKGFKYCMIVLIHKNDRADLFFIYLSDSKDDFSANMQPMFYSLKFKDSDTDTNRGE